MQYSVAKYSNLLQQLDMRLDADYYKPKYLKEDRQLDNHKIIFKEIRRK